MTELSFPALLILKSSVVLFVGAALVTILRQASASARYAVWSLAFAVILALPAGMLLGPAWRVKVAEAPHIVNTPIVAPTPEIVQPQPQAVTAAPPSTEVKAQLTLQQKLMLAWMIGTAFLLLRMIVAQIALSRIVARARLLRDTKWINPLEAGIRTLEIEREVLLYSSDRVSTPLTAGILRPYIIIPSDSESWDAAHREIVLRHELAHIARVDAFISILCGIACAIYWFNPLVWLSSARLRSEQERSCDDRVIMLGTPAADYASHLLEVAKSARGLGMSSFVSVAMARPTQLEGRLLAVLHDRSRNPLSRRRTTAATIIALAILSLIAVIHPVRAEAVVVASQASLSPIVVKPVPVPIETLKSDSTVAANVAVQSGGTLDLDLITGAGVTIRGADENRVRVVGRLAGLDWKNTTFNVTGNERDAFVTMDYIRRSGATSSSHHLDITVPRRFNVHIRSSGGEITIRNVEGTFTGNTGGGEITIENARGSARLSTGGGEVSVKNSNLSGSVTTGGGEVRIQNVTGGLNGSSGSLGRGLGSDITINNVGGGVSGTVKGDVIGGVLSSVLGGVSGTVTDDGRLYISKSGGSVNVGDLENGATISTGGGGITIGSTNGDVSAQTGGGDVTIAAADGSVKVTTGAGDVRVNVVEDGHPMVIYSGSGTVTLILPRNVSADLDLESAFTNNRRNATRIQSDWPLDVTTTRNWETLMGTPRRFVRAQQSIGGGGPKIKVRTVNGDIIVKRR